LSPEVEATSGTVSQSELGVRSMTTQVAEPDATAALYPPTVIAPPRPLPLRRFLLTFVRNPLRSLPQSVYAEPIVVHDSGRSVVAYVTDPALVERVLLQDAQRFPKSPLEKQVLGHTLGDGILTSEGASWRWQRRTAAPLFRPAELAGLVPAMTSAAQDQLARWRRVPAGTIHAIDRDMTETTFHVISATMFAGSADQEAAAILKAADATLATISWDVAAALLGLPSWFWVPGRLRRRRGGRRLRSAVAAILARRREEGFDATDLLARLASASDPDSGAPMSEARLIDNLVTFLAAGHETTAKALTWALYLLARAPEWQERIRAEVRTVTSGQPIAASHIDHLIVTRAVLKEAMRLYPPAPIMTRFVAEDAELAGLKIPAGSMIYIPIFAVHRHRRLWTDPNRFDPERFTPEREARYARTQFMPFGFGARTCIGMSFAMLEGVALLATLVAHARFGWDGRHAPEPISRVTLRPKGGMPLAVWPSKAVA
jgi:cytochrome P450